MDIAFLTPNILNKINTEFLTEEDIREYTHTIVEYLELADYYRGMITLKKHSTTLASYNFDTLKMKVNIHNIIFEASERYKEENINVNKCLFINLYILIALYHEIIHIFHNYLITESDWPLASLYQVEFSLLNKESVQDYLKYTNCLIYERDANITALENILKLIIRYNLDSNLSSYFKEEIKTYILTGYKINNDIVSPVETLFREYFQSDVPELSGIDLYDRLKLGFQTTSDDLTKFQNEADRIITKKITCSK